MSNLIEAKADNFVFCNFFIFNSIELILLFNFMAQLSEEIGRIINILEDSIEEQDWGLVKKMIDDLDEIYNQLEREESGYGIDYE